MIACARWNGGSVFSFSKNAVACARADVRSFGEVNTASTVTLNATKHFLFSSRFPFHDDEWFGMINPSGVVAV
jgi:hypothetical protein